MRLLTLPIEWRIIVFIWTLLLNLVCVLGLFFYVSRKQYRWVIPGTAAWMLSYVQFLLADRLIRIRRPVGWDGVSGMESEKLLLTLDRLPFVIFLIILILETTLAGFIWIEIKVWEREHITRSSVKESLDKLEDGICMYWANGTVKLTNEKMMQISRELTGHGIFDGLEFTRLIQEGERWGSDTLLQRGVSPVFRLKDGSIYRFSLAENGMDGMRMYELSAIRITEIYETQKQLQEENEHLQQLNRRLVEMNRMVHVTARENEILAAKIRIHDELGTSLIAAERYLTEEDSFTREDMREMILKASELLSKDTSVSGEAYHEVEVRAKDLGVKIVTLGILPQQKEMKLLTATAMTECLTNMVQHAEGTELYVRADWSGDTCIITITNDGKAPEEEVKETGGLGSLRKAVEQYGGMMEVLSLPKFVLTIELNDPEAA